jgi:hypothetical protein
LSNHQEAIAAMDFFAVSTVSFGALYYFFALPMTSGAFCTETLHDTKVVAWITQQLREAGPNPRAGRKGCIDLQAWRAASSR